MSIVIYVVNLHLKRSYIIKDLREKLADYSHNRWRDWMKDMYSNFENIEEWETFVQLDIPIKFYNKQIPQMNTFYDDLPEDLKTLSRDEADKIIKIIEKYDD